MKTKSEINPSTVWNLFTSTSVKEWITVQDIETTYRDSKKFAKTMDFDDSFASSIDKGDYVCAAQVLAIQLLDNGCLEMVDSDDWNICGSFRKTCDDLLIPNMVERLVKNIQTFETGRGCLKK